MPDISMCQNHECPLKQRCYRYTAPPCEYQTYADFAPDDDGKCEYYLPDADSRTTHTRKRMSDKR